MREFLVVSPHVDDEVLGCGGILDPRFHVHYCGTEAFRVVDRETRLAEARDCAQYLGFSFSVNLENRVNRYQLPEMIDQLETLFGRHRPKTVFLPCPSYNQDHRTVLDAALVALRPHDRNHQVANVLLYEQVHAVGWPYREDLIRGRAFQPNCFFSVDVDRKLRAYRLHASQVRGMRSPDTVRALAAWRGYQAGYEFAEGYMALRLSDPSHLVLGLPRADGSPASDAGKR